MRSGPSGASWTIRRPPVDEEIEHEAPAALDPDSPEVAPLVELIGPPISQSRWSPDLVVQTLEILVIGLDEGRPFWLKPVHAASLRVGLPKDERPGDHVLSALSWYPLSPQVVHSTSWRYEGGAIVLTYVAVVDPPARLPHDSLVSVPIERSDLARGAATAAPAEIGVAQVLEHALRHLSWLVRDDPAVGVALTDWGPVLRDYEPEPFRAL
jgi:hypothetical protein